MLSRRWLTALTAVVLAVGTPLGVYHLSVQPGAALMKWEFERHEFNRPPDFAATAATVERRSDVVVPVDGAPDSTLDVYLPRQRTTRALPVVMWIHGGGFVSGSKTQVSTYATLLASRGFAVASLDYSIAPGYRYPTPVRQANAALRYLGVHAAEFGGDPNRIFIGGDSAGGQIASQTAAVESNPRLATAMGLTPALGPRALRGALLFCGAYDMTKVAGSGFPAIQTLMWAYTGRRDWRSFDDLAQLSTVGQITHAFPSTLLTVGDQDPFNGQGHEFADVLRKNGVEVSTVFYSGDGLGHEYQFDFRLPQADAMFAATVAFLDHHST